MLDPVFSARRVIAYLALLALDLWLLFWLHDAPFDQQLTLALQLLGIYALVFGFLSETKLLQDVPSLAGLASPNPNIFIATNLTCVGVFAMATGELIASRRPLPEARPPVLILFMLLSIVADVVVFVLALALILAYLVVIVPLAYLAYLPASYLVDHLGSATSASTIPLGDGTQIRPQELANRYPLAAKNALLAFASLGGAALLGVVGG
jgi:hypothetical protein